MHHWLLKSEPDCFSIEDLRRDKKACWDGVRNYQARNFLRDEMKKGDLCIFYHSSAEPPHAAGTCVVSRDGYPDPTQFDSRADHYDADSDPSNPRWFAVDVAYRSSFTHPVSLAEIKANRTLAAMKLLQQGSRLSVLPMTAEEFREIERMGAGGR